MAYSLSRFHTLTTLQADVSTFVFLWYGVSVTLVLFNKYFLNYWHGGFPFPVTGISVGLPSCTMTSPSFRAHSFS